MGKPETGEILNRGRRADNAERKGRGYTRQEELIPCIIQGTSEYVGFHYMGLKENMKSPGGDRQRLYKSRCNRGGRIADNRDRKGTGYTKQESTDGGGSLIIQR